MSDTCISISLEGLLINTAGAMYMNPGCMCLFMQLQGVYICDCRVCVYETAVSVCVAAGCVWVWVTAGCMYV